MNAKTVITAVLAVFVVAAVIAVVVRNSGGEAGAADRAAGDANVAETQLAGADGAPEHQIVATYFHNKVRCPSCIKIEGQSRAAIEENFPEELAEGRLVYRMVNIDEQENEHFIKDYGLYTKHLVLSERANGEEQRWVDLPHVWDLLGDEDRFRAYVTENVAAYLAGEQAPAEEEAKAKAKAAAVK